MKRSILCDYRYSYQILITMKNNGLQRSPRQSRLQRSKSNTSFTPRQAKSSTRHVQVHQMKGILKYFNMNKPFINQEKRKIIEQKLNTEKIAQKQTTFRLKQNYNYLRYSYNPFMDLRNEPRASELQSKIESEDQVSKKTAQNLDDTRICLDSIVTAKDKLKNRSLDKKIALNQLNQDTFKLFTKKIDRDLLAVKTKPASFIAPKAEIYKQESQLTFDAIIRLPDRNYYAESQKQINIFAFMKGNYHGIINSDILIKNNFNFTSCVEKFQKIKFPIFRDLSKLGRDLIKNHNIASNVRLDLLNSNQLTFKSSDIRFLDILSVCTGRLNHKLVYSIIISGDAQKFQSPKSSIIEEQDVINYKDTDVNRQTNFEIQANELQENIDYLKLSNTPFEQRYEKKYRKIHNNAKTNLQITKELYKNTIHDKPLHKSYKKMVNFEVNMLLDADKKSTDENDKNIRQNKMTKNRQERLKIKELLKTVKLTNQYEEQIQQLLKGRTMIKR